MLASRTPVFQGNTPIRHMTELAQIHDSDPCITSILLQCNDGGPDHRVNMLSVHLAIIALFLKLDLDAYVTVRTPPGHSWKNMAERIMSILKLALQSDGIMRSEMSEDMEILLASMGSVSDARKQVEKQPLPKEALVESLDQPINILTTLFEQLSWRLQNLHRGERGGSDEHLPPAHTEHITPRCHETGWIQAVLRQALHGNVIKCGEALPIPRPTQMPSWSVWISPSPIRSSASWCQPLPSICGGLRLSNNRKASSVTGERTNWCTWLDLQSISPDKTANRVGVLLTSQMPDMW